jgi:enoyl-CoA hydratase/carnithine racemase
MDTACIYTTYRGTAEQKIATVTIYNPTELNALTAEMQCQMAEQLRQVEADETVRAVLLRGAGEKAFSSGGSMESLKDVTSSQGGEEMYRRGVAIRDTLMGMTKPVVAAVSGWCIGGGFEIAMACDLIYASETARFGLTEVDIGLVPGWGGAIRLPRRTNLVRAKEMLLLGTKITAQEAYLQGVINRVFPTDTLFSEVDKILDTLAAKPPLAVRGMKEILSLGNLDTTFEEARQVEHRLSVELTGTADFREAVDAFRHKRTPNFRVK